MTDVCHQDKEAIWMSGLPPWAMFAAILLVAVLMYALAWRIVQGTHIVVRAVTRILLGALLVVPVIMFFLFGEGGMMRQADKAGAPAPSVATDQTSQDDARKKAKPKLKAEQEAEEAPPAKKKQAAKLPPPATSVEGDGKVASEREDVAALQEEEEDAPASEEAAESTPTETAASVRSQEEAEEVAPETDSPSPAANGSSGSGSGGASGASDGASGFPKRRRAYRRPSSVSPPSAPGSNLTLEDLDGTPAKPSTSEAGETPPAPISLDDVVNLGVPDREETKPTEGAAPPSPPSTTSPTVTSAAPEPKEDWSIVPIFYGTDRNRADTEKRIGYDWKRGRRLELGRALVTVPSKHVVPMVERPWALKIPYFDVTLYEAPEDPKLHFTLKELKALSKEEFLNLVRERLAKSARFKDHALVFVHGYKTKFDNAVYRTAQIAYDLKFDGAPFLYSWPSGGTLQGYTYDRESASQAEPYLRQFLEIVSKQSGAKKLSVIAHSMGNQLLLRVLQDFKRSLPEGVLISQLILAAPDVDRDNFENIVSSIEGIADGITLYAASNDTALQVSRRVNGGIPRAGDVPEGGPIVIEGIDTIDATATSMDSVGINHSGYAENNALLDDIGRLISLGVRPPDVRLPTLKRIETDKGPYWRYPPSSSP